MVNYYRFPIRFIIFEPRKKTTNKHPVFQQHKNNINMRFLCLLLLCTTLSALCGTPGHAQKKKTRPKWLTDQTSVYIIGGDQSDSLAQERAAQIFREHLRTGLQADGMPRFLITDPKAKAVFAIGGYINFRMGYDFNNISPEAEFTPFALETNPEIKNKQMFLMDASTSRFYFRTVILVGRKVLQGYLSTDFRGPGTSLRLREAYISYSGFTFGKTISTFTDMTASFQTIDFDGPIGLSSTRNFLLRYEHEWAKGLSVALGLEYPFTNGRYGEFTTKEYPRVPDVPGYVQYDWGAGHLRLSGIMRNMSYFDNVQKKSASDIGWGIKLGGNSGIGKRVKLFGEVTFGQGLSNLICDLNESDYDLIENPARPGTMVSPRTVGWFAGLQYNILPKLPLTIGYSQVNVFDRNRVMLPSDYRIGRFVACNLFYHISNFWFVGLEYLYGTRTDFDGAFGQANRIQAAVQFNF